MLYLKYTLYPFLQIWKAKPLAIGMDEQRFSNPQHRSPDRI